jgi:hypothetical protein
MKIPSLDASIVVIGITIGCLTYSGFHPDGLTVLKDIMIAAVSGYFGYLKGSGSI